jgi:hypothetical protein
MNETAGINISVACVFSSSTSQSDWSKSSQAQQLSQASRSVIGRSLAGTLSGSHSVHGENELRGNATPLMKVWFPTQNNGEMCFLSVWSPQRSQCCDKTPGSQCCDKSPEVTVLWQDPRGHSAVTSPQGSQCCDKPPEVSYSFNL